MVKNEIVQPDNQELCRYGIQQLFTMLLNIIITLSIGLLMNMVLESVLFMAAYIPLRRYAGGYHAKTPQRCCVMSAVMIAVVLAAMKFVILPFYAVVGTWIIVGVIIASFAPVESKNKPLDEIETRVYRKRAIVIWAVEIALGIGFVAVRLEQFAICVSWAVAMVSFMVVAGKVKNFLINSSKSRA